MILSKKIVDNWSEFNEFYDRSKLSLTRPIEDEKKKRALVTEFPFNEITRQRIIKSTASRYLLKTDISRYYSTIYTHSISWALHGKEYAKRNIWNKKLLGNILDFHIRNTKEQQTLGIPVGPDTSLVISEILGTKIDERILEIIPDVNGFRYIDDIYIYFKTLGEAEKAKYLISSIFAEFELEMNMEKTEIRKLHNSVEPEWVSELRLHTIKKTSEKDIISYFSKIFKYSEEYPKEAVIKYGINRIRNTTITTNNWPVFEAFLMKSVLTDASCIETVFEIVQKYFQKSYNIDFKAIEKTLNHLIDYSCNYYHTYEILWSLWIIIVFELKIIKEVQIKLSKYDNPLVALMVLYLRSESTFEKSIDLRIWKEHMKSDELYGSNWLLAYEAYYKKWLPAKSGKNYIQNKKFFKMLLDNNVSFILSSSKIKKDYYKKIHIDIYEYKAFDEIGYGII